MEITLEQVERLKDKANVSYEDAKNALEQTDGDLLEALILLEQQGKTASLPGGSYATPSDETGRAGKGESSGRHNKLGGFRNFLRSIGHFLIKVITVGKLAFSASSTACVAPPECTKPPPR